MVSTAWINSATNTNRVTIRDAKLPSNADEFSEKYAGKAIGAHLDLFSGYDQLPLDEKYSDITNIITPLGCCGT